MNADLSIRSGKKHIELFFPAFNNSRFITGIKKKCRRDYSLYTCNHETFSMSLNAFCFLLSFLNDLFQEATPNLTLLEHSHFVRASHGSLSTGGNAMPPFSENSSRRPVNGCSGPNGIHKLRR